MTNNTINPNDISSILSDLYAQITGSDLFNSLGTGIDLIEKPGGIFSTDSSAKTTSDVDRIFNWGESTYSNLLPEHKSSIDDIFGYYARIYSNGHAVGEKDGNIYYYAGSGEIVTVGTTTDLLQLAVSAGF